MWRIFPSSIAWRNSMLPRRVLSGAPGFFACGDRFAARQPRSNGSLEAALQKGAPSASVRKPKVFEQKIFPFVFGSHVPHA
jgi:hypothetical protein